MAYNNITQSSGSSAPGTKKYDVFVSFRGKDTRKGFTGHLFSHLRKRSIVAFRDDTELTRGEFIASGLFHAIENSQIFIVVFSKNYADSPWCLKELEHILLQCVPPSDKRVLPVFYNVGPSDVRDQTGCYALHLTEHEKNHDFEMVLRWRVALAHAGNISGWDLRDMVEDDVIGEIVMYITKTFGYKFSYLPNELFGMLSRVEELENFLLLDSFNGVRIVGICGMGGVGKTTLASLLYGKMKVSHQFDSYCVIDDVSKVFRYQGPIDAQKQILHQTLGEEHNQISNLFDATNLIQSRLRRHRALIIFDNVDHREQLEKLVVNRESLAAGSRIIIVCRDAHILEEYGVDEVYKVSLLNEIDSLLLFCQKALKLYNITSDDLSLSQKQINLIDDILCYANGLPLAIKVLGSFLFGRSISQWSSALARLRESPNKDIMDALQFSVYGLEETELQIFLDIACFFNMCEEKFVINVLNCCGFHPDIGLRVLVDKSLISIEDESKIEMHGATGKKIIEMHGMLKELGRKIVQENSPQEGRKWSRLWLHKYCYDVMSEDMEKNVEAIVLKGNERDTQILMAEALSNMSRLRLLILKDVKFSGCLDNLSNQLRYVSWNGYPFMYLPSSFQPFQLVELILVGSSIKQLWKGNKNLPKLKNLDLSYSENLIKILDFGEIPNLERLNLEGCVKLVQIDLSIGLSKKLVFLNLKNCRSLLSIPSGISCLNSLEYLNLCSCTSEVFSNPMHLELLSLTSLYGLREVDISYCGLSQFPADTFSGLHFVQILNLGGNNFVTLPSLTQLSKLVYLNLEHCKLLRSFPELPLPAAIKHDEYWIAGMYIFNCPELGESETECSSNMAFLWMMQFVQANQESSTFFCRIEIVIPGSEIPSWFNYQKRGRSISIEPSLTIRDNNVIGLICCVVFCAETHDDPTTTIINEQKLRLQLSFYTGDPELHFSIPVNSNLIMVQSSHMWLTYFTRESFFDVLKDIGHTEGHLIRMEASIVDVEGFNVEAIIGYHWVQEPLPANL